MRLFVAIAFAFLGALVPVLAASNANESITAPRRLTLTETLFLALRLHPDIRAVDATLADKLAQAMELQLPPNPDVQVDTAPLPGSDSTARTYDVELEFPVRLSHLGLRQAYAAALKHAARAEQQAELIRVLNDTTLLYYRFWLLQKREALLVDAERKANQIRKLIAQAVEEGGAPATEANLFKAEAIRFSAEVKATRADITEAKAALIRATGLPWQEFALAEPQLAAIPQDTFQLLTFAQARANLRELTLARQRAARRRMDVARLDIFPQLTPRLLYGFDESSGNDQWGVGIKMEIPLWNFNQAELQRARAHQRVADAEANALDRVTLDRFIENRQKRAIALQEKADAYWKEVLPAYQKSYELSQQLFEQGQATMTQLWQVQQRAVDAIETALTATADALAARTLLEQTIGGRVEEISDIQEKAKP